MRVSFASLAAKAPISTPGPLCIPKRVIQIAVDTLPACLKGADTVEKRASCTRFIVFEDGVVRSFRVIGSVIMANYG